jgi:hypothetical protein
LSQDLSDARVGLFRQQKMRERDEVMVLESNGYGVKKVKLRVLESNGYGVRE